MIIWDENGKRKEDHNDFIDLGLPSGTLWSYRDFYRTNKRLVFFEDCVPNFYLSNLLPTKNQFIELGKFCNVKKYNDFYLFTSKINGNKLILFDGYYQTVLYTVNIDEIICPATTKFYPRYFWCLRLVKKKE